MFFWGVKLLFKLNYVILSITAEDPYFLAHQNSENCSNMFYNMKRYWLNH